MTATMSATAPELTTDQLDAFGEELDALRAEVVADLGERDLTYIRRVIALQRALEASGRASLLFSLLPPAWVAGTTALSLSKIIDNMEIGHNVMHGQYDWSGDPALDSHRFEWDTTCPSTQWRHSHNYLHHTHTNILGKDKDVGYGILRMTPEQSWSKANLGNPLYASLLALLFEWGVALHDVDIPAVASGEKVPAESLAKLQEVGAKAARQKLKDYVLFPILSGPSALTTITANATANVVRNLWTFSIIFCGHFPDGTVVFDEAATEGESRGHWYYRQLLGSANITGTSTFHLMSGNLSHQIEHHLFPDLPAHRYPEIAPKVQEICERYGLPYNTGSFGSQFGSVVRKIWRYALPTAQPLPVAS